ncbi:DUF5133 domain-containing protein [Streptomyces sp. NPDC059740]|uniref:DUF5133 domain-containing protein n=1 Tax=Streptomyces sp. NPDC059740 TaxID=3346926 RepID=UPI00365166EB
MVMAHPALLRELIEEYESLRAGRPESGDAEQRMDDVTYTLCVATGTRDVSEALRAARRHGG